MAKYDHEMVTNKQLAEFIGFTEKETAMMEKCLLSRGSIYTPNS